MNPFSRVFDSLQNWTSGLGTDRDKATGGTFTHELMSAVEITAAYRDSSLARRIVDIPAFDMTRRWRTWTADPKQVAALQAEEKRLKLRAKTHRAILLARLKGGSAMLLHDGASDLAQAMKPAGKKALRNILVLPRLQMQPGDLEWDTDSEGFGEPQWFEMLVPGKAAVRVHPSRVITFVGAPLPDTDELTVADRVYGDPILQAVNDEVKRAASSSQTVSALLQEAKVDIYRIPNFMKSLGEKEYRDRLYRRVDMANVGKSAVNALFMDLEEEHEQKTINFTNLPEVMQTFYQFVAGAAEIPATRFLSQSPSGMNATGESDLRNYYSMVNARQSVDLDPRLDRIDEYLIPNALGSRPPEVTHEWPSLWSPAPVEAAALELSIAQAVKAYADAGVMPPEVLGAAAESRLVQIGLFPGLQQALDDFKAGRLEPIADPEAANENAQGETGGAKPAGGAGEANGGHEITVQGGGLSIKAKVKPAARDGLVKDAAPRPLYVSRKLLNAGQFTAWAKAQGFTAIEPEGDLHVTIAYSRAAVDWFAVGTDWSGDENGHVTVPAGGPRLVEPLGGKGAVVLLFAFDGFTYRHGRIVEGGASWDWPEYQAHVTITYNGAGMDLSKVEPFTGPMRFGPEIFEEIVEDRAGGKSSPAAAE